MKFASDGVEIFEDVLTAAAVDALTAALPQSVAGLRNLLQHSNAVRALAHSPAVRDLLVQLDGENARPVRAVFFDKNPAHNWKVPWHQDLTIAVAERREVPGFKAWSVKDGVLHVQPPAELLARMITLRIHLDDCDARNGPLRVIPGSHRGGRLHAAEIARLTQAAETVCCAPRGAAIAMRPLVLHASSPAAAPSHRRVIHLEFSPDELPGGLAWFEDESMPAGRLTAFPTAV
ncbi:MAG TPA: phytanoyl-CoA dioxygenase family protein [Opitutaceae bacterium]|nr:phytanoyl-CoA dioxygenase family protein [Opitutaceae bacterium]